MIRRHKPIKLVQNDTFEDELKAFQLTDNVSISLCKLIEYITNDSPDISISWLLGNYGSGRTYLMKVLANALSENNNIENKQHSISHEWKNTPAYLCVEGVFRMAEEYLRFPQQYNVNINHINRDNRDNTRARLLRDFNHTLYYLNSSLKNKHDSLVATLLPKEKLAYLLQLYADAKYCHGIVCPGSGCQLAEDLISGKSVGVMDYYCDDEETGADFVIREFSLEDLNRALEIVINNKLQYYDILKGLVCESAMCADAIQGLVQIAIFGDVWY